MDWVILRCAEKRTLKLVEALKLLDFGEDVWTPTSYVTRRMPVSRSRYKVRVAMLPSFVFCSAARLDWLIEEQRTRCRKHPRYSVFRYQGKVAFVEEAALAGLRGKEGSSRAKINAPQLALGDKVRASRGGFEGLDGVVTGSRAGFTTVSFPDFSIDIKINTLLLEKTKP